MAHAAPISAFAGLRVFQAHDLICQVCPFLDRKSLACFKVANRAIHANVSYYISPFESLQKRISLISKDSTVGEFNQTFASLITSDLFCQISHEDQHALLEVFGNICIQHTSLGLGLLFGHYLETILSHYDMFVDALKSSQKKPSAAQIARWSSYLILKNPNKRTKAWQLYRVLQKFAPFAPTTVLEILKKNLGERTLTHSSEYRTVLNMKNVHVKVHYLEIDIRPEYWFGNFESLSSLWTDHEAIPPIIHEVLRDKIFDLQFLNPNMPINVVLHNNDLGPFSENFTLPFAIEIMNRGIFFDYNNITENLLPSFYARGIDELSNEELLELPQPD